MGRKTVAELHDAKPDVRVVLSGLWVSAMFVFVYVDVLGFFRSDQITAVLAGRIPGTGIEIDQRFLVLVTIYAVIPSLMVSVSLLARARVNRLVNIVLSVLYLVSAGVSMIGEEWIYYDVGVVVQMALWLAIARVAWTWPRRPAP
ncbi:DUF6326 family protein [Actinoplanes sp. CA-142083]|uniref:DUF6326 family protein n=1 Tax=Actinoplanes sp. CA-142083 TaxID=3239903 RepID=UPI003D931803